MPKAEHAIREIPVARGQPVVPGLLEAAEPVVLRGLAEDWPVVQAARESQEAVDQYLRRFYHGATVGAFYGSAKARGRVYYDEQLKGFNFQPVMVKLDEVLDRIRRHRDDERPPYFYIGSTTVDKALPGFRAENDVAFGNIEPLASIWIGNRTRIAAHFDVPDNLACCVAGRRRFTLFPPEQLANLYVGPLEFTPAGQAISMVDFDRPDFDRFPRFRAALENALVAELEAGDALFVPSMWWHHVESLDPLNVLVNYWWRAAPAYAGSPADVLTHALLSLRDLPRRQREAWRELFRYYVFDFDESEVAHIPEERRGSLAPIDETAARRLRAQLLNRLNR